jgi:hypothetical protein
MTPIASMVRTLIDAGTPPDVAAVVVAEAYAAGLVCGKSADKVDESAERRRERDRERKRAVRRHSAECADIPQNSEMALTLTSSSIKEEEKKEKKVSARKIPCPPTWRPSEVHFEAAAKLGVSREAVLSKAEDMRIWAGANGSLKKDWDLTFHGFIRRDAPKLQGKPNAQTGGIMAAIDAHIERFREADADRGVGEDSPRLLSDGRRQ